MYADGKPIVEIGNMSLRYAGSSREAMRSLWDGNAIAAPRAPLYTYEQILAFAIGKPSEAFGEPYRIFDEGRVIARLPGPPFQFLDRVTDIDAEPWKIVPGGWVETQYDVPPDAWYFADNRQGDMPFAVLLEIALQPCGWLAAYMGSALTSEVDVSFRNLGGTATQLLPVFPDVGTLTVRVVLGDDVADGARRLLVGRVGADAFLVHRVEDATLDGLQAVAGIGKGATDDDAERVVEVRGPHLVLDVDRFDRPWVGAVGGGFRVDSLTVGAIATNPARQVRGGLVFGGFQIGRAHV